MAGVPIPKFAVPNRDSNRVQNPQGETSRQHHDRMAIIHENDQARAKKLVVHPPANGHDYRKGSPK